jgi:hypothetical protein
MAADRSMLYGAGFAYPFAFDPNHGGVASATAVDSVRASLYRLFDTAPGEEFMLPEYGCGLKYLLFEQDTDVLRALVETEIRRAIARWEPRIAQVLSVEVTRDDEVDPNTLHVTTFFRLIQSQTVDNFVYPFTTQA